MVIHLLSLLVVPLCAVFLVSYVLYRLGSSKRQSEMKKHSKLKTCIVLGSGGHTTEMLSFLSTVDLSRYSPRVYITAATDVGPNSSANKAKNFEQTFRPQSDKQGEAEFAVRIIPRSREVGQSWLSTVWTTLKALVASFLVIWREQPDIILTNGPGTCVPICVAAHLLRVFQIKYSVIIFSESFACVDHLSLSGRILLHIADIFFVQWSDLLKLFPQTKYTGRVPLLQEDKKDLPTITVDKKSRGYIFVTVGSTSFDQLIKEVDTLEFLNIAKQWGYTGVHIQYGRGQHVPSKLTSQSSKDFDVQVFNFKDTLKQEISQASLVISHAGAGSILEAFAHQRPLIAVPNETLMNNHQTQLASKLSEEGYLLYSSASQLLRNLGDFLQKVDTSGQLRIFPQVESDRFRIYLEQKTK